MAGRWCLRHARRRVIIIRLLGRDFGWFVEWGFAGGRRRGCFRRRNGLDRIGWRLRCHDGLLLGLDGATGLNPFAPLSRNAWQGAGVPFRLLCACPFTRGLLRAHPCSRVDCSCGFVRVAGVAELVDALVLGTSILRCGGSSPFARTRSPPATRDRYEFLRRLDSASCRSKRPPMKASSAPIR